MANDSGGGQGPAIDAKFAPVADPTANVKALSEAANKRQDDLRHFIKELFDREIASLRRELDTFARHQRELDIAESERLDSIRQVDREDVNKMAAQTLSAVQTLAATTNTTAETLRTQVATTAQASANAFATTMGEVNKRLSALELASSEGKGKQTVADPMMEKLVQRMDTLLETRAASTGRSEGISASWVVLLGAVSLLGGLLGIGGVLYAVLQP